MTEAEQAPYVPSDVEREMAADLLALILDDMREGRAARVTETLAEALTGVRVETTETARAVMEGLAVIAENKAAEIERAAGVRQSVPEVLRVVARATRAAAEEFGQWD